MTLENGWTYRDENHQAGRPEISIYSMWRKVPDTRSMSSRHRHFLGRSSQVPYAENLYEKQGEND